MASIRASIRKQAAQRREQTPGDNPALAIPDLVLLRASCQGGATRAELQRDLATLLAPQVSGTQFRQAAEIAIAHLLSCQLLAETKGRLSPSASGLKAVADFLGGPRASGLSWEAVRNTELILKALDIKQENSGQAKALERVEGLSALMLQKHFGLPLAKVLSPTDLRGALAVIALERAFGNRIKTGLQKGGGLPGKTGRILAGQLFAKPREISSDGKLALALAADIYSAPADTLEGLRIALLRRLTNSTLQTSPRASTNLALVEPDGLLEPTPANDSGPVDAAIFLPQKVPRRAPDREEFSSAVVDAARPLSRGWPGNRKAFISQVWQAIRNARPEWELSEIAFKSMLAEAHRAGNLVLAAADLKDKSSMRELEESKILYKNTVWHFVRVED